MRNGRTAFDPERRSNRAPTGIALEQGVVQTPSGCPRQGNRQSLRPWAWTLLGRRSAHSNAASPAARIPLLRSNASTRRRLSPP